MAIKAERKIKKSYTFRFYWNKYNEEFKTIYFIPTIYLNIDKQMWQDWGVKEYYFGIDFLQFNSYLCVTFDKYGFYED